ncbi:MAG: ATP-dependent Clp protease ATP-binding subunit [Candidatus Kerfeldbacteria bacterium]|nr:ATP-dependent Clp protease ATP-binding subunit [Candidatus Kerfeldbacteria bacterium]
MFDWQPASTSLMLILIVLGVVIFWLYRENIKARSNTGVLRLYSKDLTSLARQNQLDPVIGREHEVERVIQILSRRTKNNPVLIGKSGVGKTAIIEGLAQKISDGSVTTILQNKKVLALDLSGLVAGTKYRGEFEKRLKSLVDEIIAAKRSIILFIDEIHTLAEAGQATGAIDAADILKPALARGDLQVIGATTPEEYKDYVEKDMTLERRFQPVLIGEVTKEQTFNILKGVRSRYEQHHQLKISDAALTQAIEMADQHIHDRYFPDKAIDLMDEAAALVKLRGIKKPAPAGSATVEASDVDEVLNEWRDESLESKPHVSKT